MKKTSSTKKERACIQTLRKINERAGVDTPVVDLVEAYARLCMKQAKPVNFYEAPEDIRSPEINRFIRRNSHLDRRTVNFLARYFLDMKKRGLRCIFSPAHLAEMLDMEESRLYWLACDTDRHYCIFQIKKDDGSDREILAPKPYLKTAQRRILDLILQHVHLNPHAEGFRKNRSILTNSRRHLGKKVLVKLDAEEFFPNITYPRVSGMFTALGYPDSVSRLLAGILTHKGRLPIGAPTSPAVSNIIATKLDKRMARLGERLGFQYSRYADDLTISSDNPKINKLIPLFKDIVREEGFTVQEKKVRVFRSGRRQKVTGIVVNQKSNVERREVRKLRAVLHNCRHKGIHQQKAEWARKEKNRNPLHYSLAEFKASLRGRINFVKAANPEIGDQLLKEFFMIS